MFKVINRVYNFTNIPKKNEQTNMKEEMELRNVLDVSQNSLQLYKLAQEQMNSAINDLVIE